VSFSWWYTHPLGSQAYASPSNERTTVAFFGEQVGGFPNAITRAIGRIQRTMNNGLLFLNLKGFNLYFSSNLLFYFATF
jgi:hypothetical protein